MKKIYKAFSLLLSMAMIFVIFISPVSAVTYSTLDEEYYAAELYHVSGKIIGEGKIIMGANRNWTYSVFCTNIDAPNDAYDLYEQCVVMYSDGTYDYMEFINNPNIAIGRKDRAETSIYIDPTKTVTSLDAEFRVYFKGNIWWEGFLFPTVTLGINA